jgi:hypothetical protein
MGLRAGPLDLVEERCSRYDRASGETKGRLAAGEREIQVGTRPETAGSEYAQERWGASSAHGRDPRLEYEL